MAEHESSDSGMATDTDTLFWDAPRRLTHEEGRAEQRLYWSKKTMAERIAAATELTRQLLAYRGIDIDQQAADLTPRFVSRRKG